MPAYIRPLKGSESLPDNVYGTLRKLGAPETCWAIGGRFDGTEVQLQTGLRDSGDGFLLSCVPGKLAYVKTEDEEFLLLAPPTTCTECLEISTSAGCWALAPLARSW